MVLVCKREAKSDWSNQIEEISSLNRKRLLYIVSFLFRSMKQSYESQGIGAESILPLFRELLVLCQVYTRDRGTPN